MTPSNGTKKSPIAVGLTVIGLLVTLITIGVKVGVDVGKAREGQERMSSEMQYMRDCMDDLEKKVDTNHKELWTSQVEILKELRSR